jgi:hypothetical protein
MNIKWFKIGKAIGIGLVFGLIAYMISGDAATSTLLAMLIIYLENKI